MDDNDEIRDLLWEYVGFAELYLHQIEMRWEKDDKIDVRIYTKLVKVDSKMGTTASKQLSRCLHYTTRSDIIKV